jgi:hypothetical protein
MRGVVTAGLFLAVLVVTSLIAQTVTLAASQALFESSRRLDDQVSDALVPGDPSPAAGDACAYYVARLYDEEVQRCPWMLSEPQRQGN